MTYLDFEKPVADLEGKIKELRNLEKTGGSVDISDEISRLSSKAASVLKDMYEKLTPAQKTQVARHPERPHFLDYIRILCPDFISLAGDRNFAEDHAIIGGIATLNGRSVMIIGHEKGHDLHTRLKHNFGMGKPEGYRKAVRLMDMADRFGLPVITLIDTPGAYPGVGAEERGQAEAIAQATRACFRIKVPIVSVIIGEGGSGGAVSLATADYILMPEHSMYSVISPEGCASILWRDAKAAKDAANALKLTSQNLHDLAIIDEIIEEPVGGAHRDAESFIKKVGLSIENVLIRLSAFGPDEIKAKRKEKYIKVSQI
ncbi:MAG: acetyl-CoA carboxylase carboxyltransferase subunit alpha [Pseudomonadota bacterium]